MFNLENKRVVIIGGSSGIGLATAIMAKQLGAEVIIAGRNPEKLAKVKQDINASTYQLNNQDDQQLQDFFSQVGNFDHLFTPGASYSNEPITADKKAAHDCFNGKFWVQFMAAKLSLEYINKDGSIVLMSGAASQRLPKGLSAATYVACNSALEGLARGLAIELAPLRVNAVAPGTLSTPLWMNRDKSVREQAFKLYEENTVLERIGTAEDIAQAAIYLMCNKNTTGSVLFPDGGFTLK